MGCVNYEAWDPTIVCSTLTPSTSIEEQVTVKARVTRNPTFACSHTISTSRKQKPREDIAEAALSSQEEALILRR
jgi:hypothetical protein